MRNPPTLTQYLFQEQKKYPEASREVVGIISDIALVAKIISREINRAGLIEILGLTGNVNIHGEEVQKLDEYANQIFKHVLGQNDSLGLMASEEEEEPIGIFQRESRGQYVLTFDPLDGSSNIEANVSVGSIFSIHKKISAGQNCDLGDLLQPGKVQVGAGYVIYGSSTMFVYSVGQGIHGFTLDPSVGEFLLSHENIKIPETMKIYSVNDSYSHLWPAGVKNYVEYLKNGDPETGKNYTARYIGSLVADFHRNLLYGGVFLYPQDSKNPRGKLRLLYEAAPLAYLIKEAGGYATDGQQPILEITPQILHERVPLFIGHKTAVKKVEEYLK